MGRETNIEWCDSTINGSSGCDGCELWSPQKRTCYAGVLQQNRLSKSMPKLYDVDFRKVRMIPGRYAQAASWSDLRGVDRPDKPWLNGKPRCIFVGDMGDTFSRDVTDDYLTRELLGAITSKQGQRHFWMLLTKRPRRLAELSVKWGGLPENVMAMTTVTDQKTANIRVPQLLQVKCHWRGLSCEPLLGPVDLMDLPFGGPCESCEHPVSMNSLTGYTVCKGLCDGPELARIDWVIAGGESGTNAQPMHPHWARNLRDDCGEYGVPFFFKQWGAYAPAVGQQIAASSCFLTVNAAPKRTGRIVKPRRWTA